jgi:biopolymer transport protein ExbB/TolQ
MENLIEIMGWGARLVMLLLGILSVWSVAIILDRRKLFNLSLNDVSIEDAKSFIVAQDWPGLRTWAIAQKSVVGGAVVAAVDAGVKNSESIERAVQSYIVQRKLELEKGLNILATLGSNAPFIGLFGTVMGIIQSFGILSNNQGSAMNAVMLGLAEALIATAIGLFVAIPALIAYNYFSQRLKRTIAECATLRDYYISKAIGGR